VGGAPTRRRGVGSCQQAARVGTDAQRPDGPVTPTSAGIPHGCAPPRTRDADGCVFRRATTTSQVAAGAPLRGPSTWRTPASAGLVGPPDGARTGPVAPSTVALRVCVPGRLSAHATRSTRPGGRGRGGGARSLACLPVCASGLTRCPPWACPWGACCDHAQRGGTAGSTGLGASARWGVSPSRAGCGRKAAAEHHRGSCPWRPGSHGSSGSSRRCTGDRPDVAERLGRARGGSPTAGRLAPHLREERIQGRLGGRQRPRPPAGSGLRQPAASAARPVGPHHAGDGG
jgi:hypothetical protein